MDAEKLQNLLHEILGTIASLDEEGRIEEDLDFENADKLERANICSYEEGLVLTQDRGLVLSLADGSRFYLTVKQVGRARKEQA